MNTRRVNCYIAGNGMAVFYIEEYNPELHDWFNIGGTYEKVEHAETIASRHNMKLVLDELLKLREALR